MTKQPTEEQRLIIECPGNIVVTAKPGSGKTYTIVEKIAKIVTSLPDYKGVIAISYTNKASDELKKRCRQKDITAKQSFFGTIDRFFISQIIVPFSSHLTKCSVEYNVCEGVEKDSKYSELVHLSTKPSPEQEALLISALAEGKIFLEKSGEIALYILNNVPGVIKYLSARYSHVFIDEYQDCGEIQHLIFLLLVRAGICGIAVGDIDQAIYAFANRFPKYLINLIGKHEFTHFELSKNHRCHPSISEYSMCLHGISHSVPEEKRVLLVNVKGNEVAIARRIDSYLERVKKKYGVEANNKIAILCRGKNTIQILDRELQTQHKVFSETVLDKDDSDWGRFFREILVARFDPNIYGIDYAAQLFSEETDHQLYREALHLCHTIFSCDPEKLNSVEEEFVRLAELMYPKAETRSAREKLHAVLSDSNQIQSYTPASENEINIMTIHKSKGLEFNIVFHMDMYKYIISDDRKDEATQMLNLHYVGVTRAIDVCYIMEGTKRYSGTTGDFVSAAPSSFLSRPGLAERRREVEW